MLETQDKTITDQELEDISLYHQRETGQFWKKGKRKKYKEGWIWKEGFARMETKEVGGTKKEGRSRGQLKK